MGSQLNHAALKQTQNREYALIFITWIMGANQRPAMMYVLQSIQLWMIPAALMLAPADAFTSADEDKLPLAFGIWVIFSCWIL